MRIFPIRTVSLLIRFGVDPVRPILANQASGFPALQGSGTSVRKVRRWHCVFGHCTALDCLVTLTMTTAAL